MNAITTRALSGTLPAVAGLMLLTAPAAALDTVDSGFYLGFSYGQTDFFNDTPLCDEFSEEVDEALAGDLGQSFLISEGFAELAFQAECRSDVSDNGTKYFVGYRFNPSFAVEVASIDFGVAGVDLSADLAGVGGTFTGDAAVRVDVSGISVTGLMGLPIGNRASIYARLGLLSWDAKGRGTATGTVSRAGGSGSSVSERFVASDDGADVHYGFGGRYRLTDHVALRAEWERYEVADLDVVSAGLELSF